MSVCPSCGHENESGAKFCSQCGAPLVERAPAREERKIVTVLFADLVGFTSKAEQMDPEDVRGLLGPYHARLRSELERFGGTVEKFIGDAVMALFGAPVAHEDDPERAVRAALAIREWALEEESVRVRIAVNTGEALITFAARPDAGEGMASGDVVNTAARLQAAAPVNGVLVGESTYRATRHVIEYGESGPVEAKGKAEPVLAWEALQARARFGVDVLQESRAPLVGRQRELDLLVDLLARVRQEQSSQLVTMIGVPGIGKSRLVFELFEVVDRDPELILWRQGRSLPYGEGVTFWALAEMTKAQAGILETDSAEAAEQKLHIAVADIVSVPGDAQWVEARLRPLVGLGGEEDLGGDRRAEAFAAWRRFFESLAERNPLVLVFEDLHWADDGLLDFVDHLADWTTDVPLLIMCTARPELHDRRPGWGGGKTNASTLSLAALSEIETARLIGALLGRAALPVETQSALLARSGGNPLYAEQYARMLLERGDDAELAMPESVQGIIAARLDALPREEKQLIQDASVLGKVFWLGALATLGDVDRGSVEERLHALGRKEFVQRARRASVAGENEYAFRHLLVRDVAYGQIPRAARAEKHRRAAEWIESLGRPEDHAEMLAHHFGAALELAGAAGADTSALKERARIALRDAGDRALALSAFPEAARFYSRAIGLWPSENSAERRRLLLRYGQALFYFDLEQAVESLTAAATGFVAAGEVEAAAEAETFIGMALWRQGRRDAAYEHVDKAIALVETREATQAKVFALSGRARFHAIAGEREEAIRLGREALLLAEEGGLDELRATALNTIGMSRVGLGDLAGMGDVEQSLAIALEISSPLEIHRAYNNLATLHLSFGHLEEAVRLRAAGRANAEHFGLGFELRWILAEEAVLQYFSGEWSSALGLAQEFIDEVAGSPHYMEAACLLVRGEIRLARGDAEGALEDTAKLLELSRQAKDPQNLVPALIVRAKALLSTGSRDAASHLVDEVLETARVDQADFAVVDLALVVSTLGRADELLPTLERLRPETPWRAAAIAVAAGDPRGAADVLAEIGVVSVEALARLQAAEALLAAGLRQEANEQLHQALSFYRTVGASHYIRQGEALLAASA